MAGRCSNCGTSVGDYVDTCPSCGAKFSNVPDPWIMMAITAFFVLLKYFILYLPFALAGIYMFRYSVGPLEMDWKLALVAAGAVILLFRVALWGITMAADYVPSPFSIIMKSVEIIVVTGLQFILVFNIAFGLFIPKENQKSIVNQQAVYMKQSSYYKQLTDAQKAKLAEMKKKLKGQELSHLAIKRVARKGMSFWQELGLEMSIASNYLYLMFKEIGNGGGTYIFALMASFVLSLVVSAAIWAYYTRNRKKEDQEIYA